MDQIRLYEKIQDRRVIIDRRRLAAELNGMAAAVWDPNERKVELLKALRAALGHGRAEIRRRMLADEARGVELAASIAFLTDQLIRLLYDFTIEHLYPRLNPTDGERITLLAVGGYGRAEMAPHSDVDLWFVIPFKASPWTEQVIETMLYALWDLRLKVGHSTRTVNELIRMARDDLSVRTALLEARVLWGDVALGEEARERYWKEVVGTSGPEFVRDKLAERATRHARMGESRYVVEPNIKEGIGGLRDLHALFWIGKYLYQVQDVSGLVDSGLLDRAELRLFLKAQDFLWTVRCHLHDVTGRAEERMTFDVQTELARRLKYADRPGQAGVERFMKHYFLTAKQVGDLTALFLAHLQQKTQRRGIGWLKKMKRPPARLNGFVTEGGQISIPAADWFRADPIRLLELFHLADLHGLEIHPEAKRQAGRDSSLITARVRALPAANQLFIDILTSPRQPERILREMNESGVFGRFIPDFGRVVAQMQFDMYHHYTVDEHTIRAIGLLSKIEKGELSTEHPLSSGIIQKILSRRVLYVAVLLHDIAKGRGGDHSVLGAQVARALCPRLGLSAAETETVAWLVEKHLLMSATAFKRDLNDFKTIMDFAEQVQSPERLRLLLILTVVDIRAVGPNIWNNWKGQLLTDLYESAEEVLVAGHKQTGRQDRITAKLADLAEQLAWPKASFARYRERFFDSYWLAEAGDVLFMNAELVRAASAAKLPLATSIVVDLASATTLVSVYTGDHPGIFCRIAGAIALGGANIVDAKIHTTRDGMALDNFTVQDPHGNAFDEPARLERLKQTIADALAGKFKLSEKLASKPPPKPRADAFRVEPNVLIDNRASNRYTVIEINALDRPALLYHLTDTLFHARVTIKSAHIATYGERAVDVFYVTDLTGEKVTNGNRLKALERRLLAAAAGTRADEDEEPARIAAAQ